MKGAFLATVSSLLLAGGPSEELNLRTTLSAETLRLPQREALGLLGISTTAAFGPWYLGPGLYGAARGERGGFFTFGLEGGLGGRFSPSLPLTWRAGLFVGGGGGASAPQGGGLMLRPHLGVSTTLGGLLLGAEVSHIRFPNGGIDSTQVALTLAIPTRELWVPAKPQGLPFDGAVAWEGRELGLAWSRVQPAATARTRSGGAQLPLDLATVALASDLTGPAFRFFEVAGAFAGSSSGYAQALGGLGLRLPLAAGLSLEARLGAGVGGGGDIDTGGGFLLSGEGLLTFRPGAWGLSAGLGLLRAPAASFRGRTLTVRLSRRFEVPLPSRAGEPLVAFDLSQWRMGSSLLTYDRASRQDGTQGAIQILNLRADRLQANGFYLSAEAGSAIVGGAGGYSTGLAGLGWETPRWARQQLFAEGALGAGGGGGLRSGGGLLASLRAGWRLDLPQGLGLEATVGRVRAPRGDLASTTLGLGLHFRFQGLER